VAVKEIAQELGDTAAKADLIRKGGRGKIPKDGITIYDLIAMRDRGDPLTTKQKKRISHHFWSKMKRETDPEWVEKYRQFRRDYENKRYNEDAEWRSHRNRRRVLMKYDLPEGGYDAMLKAQDGKCGICKSTEPRSRSDKFHIDHCHKTGKVRKLLCGPCNTGIGSLGDNPDLLRKAAVYIESERDE
jgi:hypothetical protein